MKKAALKKAIPKEVFTDPNLSAKSVVDMVINKYDSSAKKTNLPKAKKATSKSK